MSLFDNIILEQDNNQIMILFYYYSITILSSFDITLQLHFTIIYQIPTHLWLLAWLQWTVKWLSLTLALWSICLSFKRNPELENPNPIPNNPYPNPYPKP